MDKIEALKSKLPFPLYKDREILCIFINGKRLDEILFENVNEGYLGLVPAWLDWYDEDYQPSMKEKQYVWEQMRLENGIKILPIMLCPDDFDFFCTTVVVEVIDQGDIVAWNRFGIDVTDYDADEEKLPKYIGKKVKWFSNIRAFLFSKADYLKCVDVFESSVT